MTTWQAVLDIADYILGIALLLGGLWYGVMAGDYARGTYYFVLASMNMYRRRAQ